MINLFSSDEDFRKFLSVNAGFTANNLSNQFNEALETYVFPYCSREQFDASILLTTDKHIELIRLIKNATANLGMFLYMPVAKVQISNAGISYATDKTKQASPEDKSDLAYSFRRTGLVAIETMIAFLETNEAIFTVWKNSIAYTNYTSLLIRTSAEFKIINNSRQVFLQLIPYIEDVELDIIKSAIPSEILTKLYSRIYSNSTEKILYESLLFDYVQPIIRSFAMAQAISALAIVRDSNNTLSVYDDTASGKSSGNKEAPQGKLSNWKEDLEKQGNSRLLKMNQFIVSNADGFGLIVAIELQTIPFKNTTELSTAFF